MAVDRLVGVDHTLPRLPQSVIDATKGTTVADLAAGDTLAAAKAYTDATVAAGGGGMDTDIGDARYWRQWSGSQAEYDALDVYDGNTLYVIVP